MAIVIALVAALAVWLGRDSSSSQQRSVLHLAGATGATAAMAASVPSVESPTSVPGQEPYKLIGTLPEGQPPDAAVYRLPKATAGDAADVARALHLDGTPVRAQGGWVLRSGNNRLAVRDNGSWSYSLDCFSGPEAQEELTVECAYAGSGTATAVSPGSTSAPARTNPSPPSPTSPPEPSAAPEPTPTTPYVDGLEVVNWTQWFVIKAGDGSIDSGSGWVGTPQRGASYPLITAQRAFELLQEQPRPMMELCMARPDGEPGCAPIPPSEVTGAKLGLTLDYDSGKPVLVPAWLFAIKGQTAPVMQVALQPQYLATPSPQPYPTVKGVPVEPPAPAQPASP